MVTQYDVMRLKSIESSTSVCVCVCVCVGVCVCVCVCVCACTLTVAVFFEQMLLWGNTLLKRMMF